MTQPEVWGALRDLIFAWELEAESDDGAFRHGESGGDQRVAVLGRVEPGLQLGDRGAGICVRGREVGMDTSPRPCGDDDQLVTEDLVDRSPIALVEAPGTWAGETARPACRSSPDVSQPRVGDDRCDHRPRSMNPI